MSTAGLVADGAQSDDSDEVVTGAFRRPWMPGKLVGPSRTIGHYLGNGSPGNMALALSPLDENIPSAGAAEGPRFCSCCGPLPRSGAVPLNGEGFLSQLARGPYNWFMFLSCTGFIVPAIIHAMFGTFSDFVAMGGLICVSISSPICDAFCIHYGVFDSSQTGYEKTGLAVAEPPDHVKQQITEKQAAPELLCTDYWNNLTRFADRSVCAVITLPCVIYYVVRTRPGIVRNLPCLTLALQVLLAAMVHSLRSWEDVLAREAEAEADEVLRPGEAGGSWLFGRRMLAVSYKRFEVCHITWHAFLILGFISNALDRP